MLRKYQISAIEGVLDKIHDNQNGYVWMSSNTGKSTTSFRLAEILKSKYQVIYISTNYLSKYPKYLTVNNYNEFLDAVSSKKLIITNIRSILSKPENLEEIKDDKFIFIFNEYEKYNHKYNPEKLMNIFTNSLFYCFTSTPIFDENIIEDKTTKYLFSNQISKYSFKDAINDKTNLILDCEYIGDEEISADYDLSSDLRINQISDYISQNCNKSILIVSSNKDVIRYYGNLSKLNLNVVPILRHSSNDIFESKPMRDYFEKFINEYNDNFNAGIYHKKVVDTTRISRDFELDVIKRFNLGEIDLLIVDGSMFKDKYRINLLGNLNKLSLNTLFLDCNLNYESLFEALMMVSEVDFNHQKQANIKVFRDIKSNISKTIKLYSDVTSSEECQFRDYDYYLNKYNHYLNKIDEDFIKNYEKLSYYYNILTSFDEFSFSKSENDEYNKLKDKYEHQKYELGSNKKIISAYNPKSLDKFTIDLDFISNEKEEDDNDSATEITENNFNYNQNNNILSLHRHDNSKNLNIVNNNQDLSNNINVKNEYHIHIGGDNIQKRDDLPYQLDLIEKKEESNKVCPDCGKEYPVEFNYCPDHTPPTELVYPDDLTKICKSCGSKHPEDYNYCPNCGSKEPLVHIYKTPQIIDIKTNPNKYFNFKNHDNRFGEIEDLLSQKNYEKLINFNLAEFEFDNIVNNIKITSKRILDSLIYHYHIDFNSLSTLDKILLIAKSFVKTDFKEGGGDLGYFEFNEIYVDDRASDALQITTIIHELSHFLLAEILEQIISELLNTDKTDALEAFVCFTLVKDEFNYLVDEYCAHTVEGRFAVLGYQDYGSYKSVLLDFKKEYSEEYIDIANEIGNTFAFYIKDILTSFIDDNLRRDIKDEFTKINDVPKYSELQFETKSVFEWQRFSKAINLILTRNIDEFINNPQDLEQLKSYAIKFKNNNG